MKPIFESFFGAVAFAALAFLIAFGFGELSEGASLYLHTCSKTTCMVVEGKGIDMGVALADVSGISDSEECPGICASVRDDSLRVHVVGNWMDVMCRAWGGWHCGWDRVNFTPDMLKHLQRGLSK